MPIACESFPTGVQSDEFLARSGLKSFSWEAEYPEEQHSLWMQIIQGYSQRSLTRSEDRLPAIAGVARRVQSILQDDYLAGMFRSELPSSPLWQNSLWRHSPILKHVIPSQYPSWSWASYNGSVEVTPSRK